MSKDHDDVERRSNEAFELMKETTGMHSTPDPDNEDLVWLYSYGMRENYDMHDVEMVGVPTAFQDAAAEIIMNFNACRIFAKAEWDSDINDKFNVPHGQALTTVLTAQLSDSGELVPVWRLEYTPIDWENTCECCRNKRAGIEE